MDKCNAVKLNVAMEDNYMVTLLLGNHLKTINNFFFII